MGAGDNRSVERYVLVIVLGCIAAGCGSDDRGVTQPTPQSAVVLVHDTLNPPSNRSSRRLLLSENRYWPPGYLGFVDHRAYDDFTSPVTTASCTVSWQGGHCEAAPFEGGIQPPIQPPVGTSRSFQIAFYSDNNGRPSITLHDVTLTPADAHEQFTFDTGPTTGGCNGEAPSASYYDYTAVLPTPFPVTAGIRYWFMVRADVVQSRSTWGWRVGMPDNNYSMLSAPQSSLAAWSGDLAFSLSAQ